MQLYPKILNIGTEITPIMSFHLIFLSQDMSNITWADRAISHSAIYVQIAHLDFFKNKQMN